MRKIEYAQEQIVQKKSVKWKCDVCGKEYRDEGDAYTCEKRHKNKEALSKVEPKFKAGDVVLYNGTFGVSVERICRVVPIDDYDRWAYALSHDTFMDTVEESELTFVCSRKDYMDIVFAIRSNLKNKLGILKKNMDIQLLSNGEFAVRFTVKDDKIPVIKRED